MRLPWETLGNYAKQVNEVEDILTRSTQRTQQATMDAMAYKKLEVEQTIAGDRKKLESAGATQEQLQQFDVDAAALRTSLLDEIAKEEEAANAKRLQEARQHSQEIARIMQELGEATGDTGLQRAGLLSEITTQAEALKLLATSAEEFDLIERQANLKAAQARRDTATDFAEYWRVSMDELGAMSKAAGDQEKAIWGEVLQEWLTNSATMAAAREAAYGRVIEAAQASGNVELAVIAQVARESAALERLQTIQQTGSPREAFLARMAEGLEEFKSAATKARESAVAFADSLLEIKREAAAAIGQLGSDLLYGALMGEEVDAFATLGETAARAFSDKFGSVLEDLMNDVFDSVLSEFKNALSSLTGSGGGLFGGLLSSIFGGG
ncbi:coiled-coil domain-containing protein, partial [Megalodesulfovibrio gigas]|uniref:hypothetical protein n=1 Tax=Megalodesulfovibrio gigas TaxID=879 RepID=UPI00187D874A